MLRFIKRLVGPRAGGRRALAYEEARGLLETQDTAAKRALAARTDLEPEMLYYLAHDADTSTRASVAANGKTPHQANAILADDDDTGVREELARKIARLLPDLSAQDTHKLRDQTLDLMEKLARDQAPRVRAILAEEIKSSTIAPPHIVQRLARDMELSVCGPVLRYSPLLSDADLIELIATSQVHGALEAIAGRAPLAADVADAVVATLDIPAVAALLTNADADIRASTMDDIIEAAHDIHAWHAPLTLRADLSLRAVRRIAQFVGRDLLSGLADRAGLDDATRRALSSRLTQRLDEIPAPDATARAAETVQRAHAQGRLDAAFVIDAAEAGHADQVVLALAVLSGLHISDVQRVMASANGKAMTALVWRTGLPMRVSVAIQTHVMKLTSAGLVPARGGSEFPFTDDDMTRMLDYFGIAA